MRRGFEALPVRTLMLFATIGGTQFTPSPLFAMQHHGVKSADTREISPHLAVAAPPLPTLAEVQRAEEWRSWEAFVLGRKIQATHVLEVVPNPDARDTDRERQLVAANLISQQAQWAHFLPEGRLQHYSWINSDTCPPITGWKGTIKDMVELPGGLHVRLHVTPAFPGNFMTNVYTVETFKISKGVVSPVAIEYSDPSRPRVITNP